MKLWLDDVREPHRFGALGWTWAKTAEEAIEYLKTGEVTEASLDHDLAPEHYPWSGLRIEDTQGSGYDVVCFLEANPQYMPEKIKVHSMNPVGAARMCKVLTKLYGETIEHRPASIE